MKLFIASEKKLRHGLDMYAQNIDSCLPTTFYMGSAKNGFLKKNLKHT